MSVKTMPDLRTDGDAERFVEEADLSEYDLSGFTPVQFEFLPKDKQISLRLSKPMLQAIKKAAKQRGVSYQRYIRQAVESILAEDAAGKR